MTYKELAAILVQLGHDLDAGADTLSGEPCAKIAKTLGDNAIKLNAFLKASVQWHAPETAALRTTLDQAIKWADVKRLQAFAVKLGFKLPGGSKATVESSSHRFLELTLSHGLTQQAIDLLSTYNRVNSQPAPTFTSDAELRAELRRLGSKSADEIEMDLIAHYDDDKARQLAKAAGLKVTKTAKLKTLMPKLIHHAQRHYENTAPL